MDGRNQSWNGFVEDWPEAVGRFEGAVAGGRSVDDMVDSGWTLTMAALLLREHGSGPVYPFALARASLRGS